MKRMPVAMTITLAVLTCGMYVPWWFLTRRKTFNRLSGPERLNILPFAISLLLIAIALGMAVFGWMRPATAAARPLFIPAMLVAAAWLILLVQSFKARNMVQYQKPGLQLSGLLIFLFQVFYLQYHVNRIRRS